MFDGGKRGAKLCYSIDEELHSDGKERWSARFKLASEELIIKQGRAATRTNVRTHKLAGDSRACARNLLQLSYFAVRFFLFIDTRIFFPFLF
jgi:hypothetical protein